MANKAGWQGRCYDDFEVGDVYDHRLGRTITDADNIWFTLLTLNTNQFHFNADLAEDSVFKKPIVDSCFTLSLVTGMSVSDLSENAMANLAWTDISMPHPVFHGDTLYARSEVLGKRESSSRPYAGIVDVKTEGFNQDGDLVISFKRTFMVYKREHLSQEEAPREEDGGGRDMTVATWHGDATVNDDIVSEVARFAEREVKPIAHDFEARDEYPQQLVDRMRDMGLFGAIIPEEYGGAGLNISTYSAIVDVISRAWMSVTGVLNSHLIMAYDIWKGGTEAQRRTWLPELASGRKHGGIMLSDPVPAPTCKRSRRPRAAPATATSSTARRCG